MPETQKVMRPVIDLAHENHEVSKVLWTGHKTKLVRTAMSGPTPRLINERLTTHSLTRYR